MPAKRTRVCSHIDRSGRGCPNLQPCPVHARPANARWSRDRDPAAQARFRRAVLKRDQFTCTRCGHHDRTGRTLVAHHVRPGYATADGRTLCDSCHRAVDSNAR
jgi:5-methylcytosine-specific restriction endonuclease McrA